MKLSSNCLLLHSNCLKTNNDEMLFFREYYSIADNPHRRETFEEATEINKKYGIVWKHHPNFHQIDNYDNNDPENKGNLGWEGKFLKVWAIVEKLLED